MAESWLLMIRPFHMALSICMLYPNPNGNPGALIHTHRRSRIKLRIVIDNLNADSPAEMNRVLFFSFGRVILEKKNNSTQLQNKHTNGMSVGKSQPNAPTFISNGKHIWISYIFWSVGEKKSRVKKISIAYVDIITVLNLSNYTKGTHRMAVLPISNWKIILASTLSFDYKCTHNTITNGPVRECGGWAMAVSVIRTLVMEKNVLLWRTHAARDNTTLSI